MQSPCHTSSPKVTFHASPNPPPLVLYSSVPCPCDISWAIEEVIKMSNLWLGNQSPFILHTLTGYDSLQSLLTTARRPKLTTVLLYRPNYWEGNLTDDSFPFSKATITSQPSPMTFFPSRGLLTTPHPKTYLSTSLLFFLGIIRIFAAILQYKLECGNST